MQIKHPWIVIKFGGTSVSSRACWENIRRIAQKHLQEQKQVFVVCSAPSQVSNHLETLIEKAIQQDYQAQFAVIKSIYQCLAADLDLDFDCIEQDFIKLWQLCEGIALLEEASPKIQARIMAFGELTLTKLGYNYLKAQGFDLAWQDARKLLIADAVAPLAAVNYLNANCDSQADPALISHLQQLQKSVVITQGFIAGNRYHETVLLGRGGSDTSAACFAAKLSACACEIWTDVPGIYTANPHLIPEARLLKQLDYAEVQEIASLGAKVLHPRCIAPLQQSQIPIYVKYTAEPHTPGTCISLESEDTSIPIKAIITRYKVWLISIESISMWKQAGFLAEVFTLFKKYHLSIDLISTSESNITLSLDPTNHAPNMTHALEAVLAELNQFASAKLIGPCASISLVGRHIRAILHQLSEAFEVFASQKIYLLSQAANDLNLTFVVEEDQAERLAKKLHNLLIEQNPKSHFIGKSWLETYGKSTAVDKVHWWQAQRQDLLNVAEKISPAYIYSGAELEKSADNLAACSYIDKIFYAVKANPHADILKLFYHKQINFECVSLAEIQHIRHLFPNIDPKRILFTPNFAPRAEYQAALDLQVHLTIDSLFPLRHWPELFRDKEVLLRVDPGQGSGHHKYVCTGGSESKFGITQAELAEAAELAEKHQIQIIGLHAHNGSGILQADLWIETARILTSYLNLFPQVKMINVGGGLGIAEKPGQQPLDLDLFNASFKPVKSAFPQLSLWIEPGRYLVATAGVLLARVTQVKQKEDLYFIGIETGMNSLIRPALYGSYHEIVNLSQLDQPKAILANIVGPICETGDTLGYSRLLPPTEEGDILLIATTGAYGHSMSSHYNLRAPATEYFLENTQGRK